MRILFWISAALILYTYGGYPLIIHIWSKVKPGSIKKSIFVPQVSIITILCNEEQKAKRRIENLLTLDYPQDKVQIIVVSDGSTDTTSKILKEFSCGNIIVDVYNERKGKPARLNEAVQKATGDILIFCDARQTFDREVIKELAGNFNDPKIGVVSGELVFKQTGKTSVGEGVDFYWKYEKFLRKAESSVDSTCGATGAIYAIRKELFEIIPEDSLVDDVIVPMSAVIKGYRCIFEPKARAHDEVAATEKEEERRKIRTIAGNVQMFLRNPGWIVPGKNRIWFQMFSHKFLRLFIPGFLIVIFVANIFLLEGNFYRNIFILQMVFYACSIAGFLMRRSSLKIKIFSIPYAFLVMNYFTVKAVLIYFGVEKRGLWKK